MLDERDRKILEILQRNANKPVADIAGIVNLSVSACSRRIQKLEEDGYIAARHAVLDRCKIGLPTTVFALVKTSRHSDDWVEAFHRTVSRIPEIVEAHRLTGNFDYILKIVLPSVEYYDTVYKQIISQIELFDMSASISMEALKDGAPLPIHHAV